METGSEQVIYLIIFITQKEFQLIKSLQHAIFFIINMGFQVNLHISRLIS